MKPTGQCLKDFEKWLNNKKYSIESEPVFGTELDGWQTCTIYLDVLFQQLPPSMQYGVLVDFFDSVGIYISTQPFKREKNGNFHVTFDIIDKYITDFSEENYYENLIEYDTRREARKQAILKANEIHNINN